MCGRSLVRLKYLARSMNWCNNKIHACNMRKAKRVPCETFLSVTKGCRSVQETPSVVSFYNDEGLVGQTVWKDVEGDSDLQFRLLLA